MNSLKQRSIYCRLAAVAVANDDNFSWADAQREADRNFLRKALPTFNRNGLDAIASMAVADYQKKTGHQLPWNLALHGPYVGLSWGRKYRLEGKHASIVEDVARFCGWLRAATTSPSLVRVIKENTTPNGMGSPYTTVNPWELAKRHPSPGRAGRFLVQVRRRANQILKPYGLQVSWVALGDMMLRGSIRNVGKAAKLAAAGTIKHFLNGGGKRKRLPFSSATKSLEILIKARGLRELIQAPRPVMCWAVDRVEAGEFSCFREALTSASRLIEDQTDGVSLIVDPLSATSVHGIKVTKGWAENGSQTWLLKTAGGQSYHAESWYDDDDRSRRQAIQAALSAWGKQKKLERENREFLRKLQPHDRSVLVYFEDSLSAGNCRPGTESWMSSHGLSGKKFVGVHVLLKHLHEDRVRRVLQAVANRL
jgi:hypothetical protein